MSLNEIVTTASRATMQQKPTKNLDDEEEIRDDEIKNDNVERCDVSEELIQQNVSNEEDGGDGVQLELKTYGSPKSEKDQSNDVRNQNGSDIEDKVQPSGGANKEDKINDDDDDDDSDEEDKDESSESGSDVQNLINRIFGDSDDEEEFEGFDTNIIKASKRKEQTLSSSGEEEGEDKPKGAKPLLNDEHIENDDYETKRNRPEVYDFDLMMERKKQEGSRSRKRRNYDVINDSDDLIAEIIKQMHTSAEEDRLTNRKRLPARSKIKLLPVVVSQVKKADLKVAFLDQGILSAMAEWLAPLPDKSLPYIKIRESLFKLLEEFPPIDPSLLKSSRIGKIVMYLYKHPKETRENKKIARQLIMDWSRPIFNVKTDFNSMSREERELRDLQRVPKKMRKNRQLGNDDEESLSEARKSVDLDMGENDQDLKPGEKGWIPRAVVPKPSNKEYLVRPKWNVETDPTVVTPKKKDTRIDKHMRHFEDLKKKQRGVAKGAKLSIMGN